MVKWLATFILLWFIYTVRHIFPPIIVGAIIAYLLLPVVQQLSKACRISIQRATMIIYVLGLGLLVAVAAMFGPGIVRDITELANHQHEIVSNVVKQLATSFHWETDAEETTGQILSAVGESIAKPTEIMHLGGILSHGMLSILVCIVSSIYFIIDSDLVFAFFLRYLPEDRRGQAVELTAEMNRILSRYVRGQLFLILFMAGVAWAFLNFFMHMKHAVPVAILSGFLEIIPVLGPILATTTATLVGVAQFGPQAAIFIVPFYWIARLVEDYAVVPRVIGHAVEMHPLAVIFAVLCGETLAGGLGMLIAIPVAACIKLFIDFFYLGKTPESLQEKTKQTTAERARVIETVAQEASDHADEIAETLAGKAPAAPDENKDIQP